MSAAGQDIRVGCRMLVQRPGFAAAVIACLGLAIGGITAVFSVINGVTVRFMPYERVDRLVFLVSSGMFNGRVPAAAAQVYLDWKSQNRAFADMAAYQLHEPHAASGGWTQTQENLTDLQGLAVTPNFFSVLGMRTLLGRALMDSDQGQSVVVLSHHVWRDKLGGDPHVLGRSVLLGGQAREIVGIAAAGYRHFPSLSGISVNKRVDYWLPVSGESEKESRDCWNYAVLGRLKPGITLSQAQADMDRMLQAQRELYPDKTSEEGRMLVEPVPQMLAGSVRTMTFLTLGAAAFTLLIACANVINLLLVRSLRRKTEMAVRSALGSSRLRIVGQMICENLILVLLGGGLGILLAQGGTKALLALAPRSLPGIEEICLDARVLVATMASTFLIALIVGVVPGIVVSRMNLANALRGFGTRATSGAGERRTLRAIVVSEVVLSFVLVIGASLLIRSYWRLMQVELGFQSDRVLTLRLSGRNLSSRHDELLTRLQSLPGVEAVASSTGLPLSGEPSDSRPVNPVPADKPLESYPTAYIRTVSTDYLGVLGASLARGRTFAIHDNDKSNPVVVMNEALARKLWPGEDPIGRRVAFGHGTRVYYDGSGETLVEREVIGVVRDIRYSGPDQDPPLEVFIPFAQRTRKHHILSFAMRCHEYPVALTKAVRQEAQTLDGSFKVESLSTIEGLHSELTAPRRFLMAMLSVFAAVAFSLAAIGIYGVVAFTVSTRVHEMGIRIALGAHQADILRLVMRHGVSLTVTGVGLGLCGTVALQSILASQVFGISPLDPITIVVGVLVVVMVLLLACYFPARRAARIDPMVALRHE